jgi:large subunit ribosomal protein L21
MANLYNRTENNDKNKSQEFLMYAIIEQGGKQFKVSQGDVIDIELTEVAPDAKTIELNKVLFVADGQNVKVGTPYLDGAKVIASFKTDPADAVIGGPKLYPATFRRRKNSSRKIGHRQKYLQITIDSIEA